MTLEGKYRRPVSGPPTSGGLPPPPTAAPCGHGEDGRPAAVFAYDGAVTERFPTIRAGVVHATGLANGPSSPELLGAYRAEQRAASDRLRATPVADVPSIAAWRRSFARFGAKPTQHRNAAEALLRRLAKHGDVPTVDALVDVGNLVSVRRAVPVAVFDLADVATPITVRFATGDERFADLGSTASVPPGPAREEAIPRDDRTTPGRPRARDDAWAGLAAVVALLCAGSAFDAGWNLLAEGSPRRPAGLPVSVLFWFWLGTGAWRRSTWGRRR